MSNLNRVRLSCCWVGVGMGCDNFDIFDLSPQQKNLNGAIFVVLSIRIWKKYTIDEKHNIII